MHNTKRFIRLGLSTFLFCLTAFSAMFSLSVSAADEDSSAVEIRVEDQININTADAETLALALDGIGMTRAQDIIAYRDQHGDFETVEQLQEVSGIGPATLERNRSRILLADHTE